MDLTAAASRVTLARVSAGPWSTDVAPFAGRAGELSQLRRRAEEARQGRPRVVLIEAEPGFGKSALLSQFLTGLDRASLTRDDVPRRLTVVATFRPYAGHVLLRPNPVRRAAR